MECLTEANGGSAAFFRRLQSPLLLVQSAMLLLRQCAVPQLNYQLRCMAPSCVSDVAAEFDQIVLTAAYDKLQLRRYERTAQVERLLRFKLMHGGFGLTSAVLTSHRPPPTSPQWRLRGTRPSWLHSVLTAVHCHPTHCCMAG